MIALALVLAAAAAACPGGTVIERADLDAAGVDHVSDLLRFVPDLPSYSVDGFDATPLDGRTFGQPLRVLIDGAPAASTTSLEPLGIDGIPVAVSEIVRVTYCPGPGVAAGRWGGAWLDVETRAPARRALGAVFYGNETGDPGPLRYADPGLPNVDHWGPDFEGAAVVRRGERAAWASARDRNLFPTDTAMAARVFDVLAPGRFPARAFTTVQAALDLPSTRARAAYARADDLPFVPVAARELPANRRTIQGSARTDLFAGRRVVAVGVAHAARLRLARPAWSATGLSPEWTETRASGAVEARLVGAGLRAGVQADVVQGQSLVFDSGAVPVGRLYAAAERRTRRGARSLTLAAAASGSGAALSAGLAETRPLGPATLTLTLAAGTDLPEESPDVAFWASRGYAGVTLGAVELLADRAPGRAGRLLGRLDARAQAGRVALDASAEALRATGDALVFRLVPDGAAFAGTARLSRAEGQALRARLGAGARVGPVALRTDLMTEGAVGGNGAFRETWRRRAVLRAVTEATLRPDARLSLRARLDARTATRWDGYPQARVPPQALLDVALVRRFWGERLRAQIVGRNVLGAAEVTHPLGALLAPRLFVRLDARL